MHWKYSIQEDSRVQRKKVIILDNLSSSYEWNIPKADNIEFVRGDILDDEALKRVFKEKPDHIFHLAAHFANQNSVDVTFAQILGKTSGK